MFGLFSTVTFSIWINKLNSKQNKDKSWQCPWFVKLWLFRFSFNIINIHNKHPPFIFPSLAGQRSQYTQGNIDLLQEKKFEMSVDNGLTNGSACLHQSISSNSAICWSLMSNRSSNRNTAIYSFICQKTLNHLTQHQDRSYLSCCLARRSDLEVCVANKWIYGNTSWYLYWHL